MPEIVAQISNLALPQHEAALGTVATHRKLLDAVEHVAQTDHSVDGYNGGYEITPTRILTAAIRGQLAMLHDDAMYRGPRPLYSSVHHGWAGNNVFGLVMHREHGSIKVAEELGVAKLDAVLFGDARHNGQPVNFSEYDFAKSGTGVQLTAEVFEDWGINGADKPAYDQIPERMEERGLRKGVVDPFHLYRAHRKDHSQRIDPVRVLEVFEDRNVPTDRVHLRAGTKDHGTAEDFAKTEQDLGALLDSPEVLASSAMGELVLRAYNNTLRMGGERFSFVDEVTHGALVAYHRRAHGEKAKLTRVQMLGYRARIVANTRAMLAKATPLAPTA